MKFINTEKFERLPLKRYYIFAFFFNIFIISIGLLSQFILPPEIPLYYGLPQNDEQLAPAALVILPSLVAMFMTVLNAYFSMFAESTFLKKVLAFTSIAVSLLSAITIVKIIFLVGSI